MNPSERRFAVLISIGHGLQHFLRRIFPPLIPVWVIVFDFPLALAGLILGVQSLGSALGQAPFGVLSDRYDRRYLMPGGIAFAAFSVGAFSVVPFLDVFAVDVKVLGTTTNLELVLMVLLSFCVGFGGSVLHPTGYPLMSENVRPERKGRALGIWGSGAKFGDAGGPAAVGALLLVLAWTDVLLLFSVVGIGFSVVLFFVLGRYETRPAGMRAAADSDGRSGDPSGVTVRGMFRRDHRLFVYPILAVFAFFVIRMLAASGIIVFIPEFITREYGYAFTVFGVTLTATSTASFYYSALLVTAGVAQLGTGRLVDRYDSRKVMIGLLLVATVALAALTVAVLSPAALFAVLLVMGAGMWAIEPARDAIISEIAPSEIEGRTFGYLWTGGLVISAVSPVLVGYIGDVTGGLRPAFALLAVTTLLSIVPIALLLSPRIYLKVESSYVAVGSRS